MSLRGLYLCSTALVLSILLGLSRASGQSAAPAAPIGADNSDIELAKPPKYPLIITPLLEGGVLRDNHHGDPLTEQELAFNPATHELSLAKNSPVKQRAYGDSRIDSANYNSDLTLFDYLTTDRAPIGKIVVICAKKKVIISANYVVIPAKDEMARIDPATYCAALQFVKGDECNKPGTTVTLRRNQDPPAPLSDADISKISRRNDVMTWTIERGGSVIKTGSFGFPVVATAPGLVRYVIQLP